MIQELNTHDVLERLAWLVKFDGKTENVSYFRMVKAIWFNIVYQVVTFSYPIVKLFCHVLYHVGPSYRDPARIVCSREFVDKLQTSAVCTLQNP